MDKKISFGLPMLLLVFASLVLFGCLNNGNIVNPTGTPTPTITASPTPNVSEQPPQPPEGSVEGEGLPELPPDDSGGLNTSEEPPDILDNLD